MQRFKNSYFGIFLNYTKVRILVVPLQIAAISIVVLYRYIVHNLIVYLKPILVRSAGD